MGHIRKPRVVRGTQRRKYRNGRPHRAAKIPGGLCLPGIPYLAPLRRNRAAVRREGEHTRGTPGPPRKVFYFAAFAFSHRAVKAAGSWMAVSLSILRFMSMPASFRPCIKVE